MSNYIKISPSLLEQYRVVLNGEWGKTTADLIEYITKEYQKNIHTSRGDAWHMMMEHGPMKYAFIDDTPFENTMYRDLAASQWPHESMQYKVFEPEYNYMWVFSAECVQPIYDYLEQYPDVQHEVWHTHHIECEGFRVRVRMKYDGFRGLQAEEFKTTGSAKKFTDYEKSAQCKMYLVANPELQCINYNIFQLNTKNTRCKYYRYTYQQSDLLKDDIMELMTGFINWLKLNPRFLKILAVTGDNSPWAK